MASVHVIATLFACLLTLDAADVRRHRKDYIVFIDTYGQLRSSSLEEPKVVPKIDAENDVQFHLYTRDQTSSYLLIVGDAQNLQASTYDAGNPTKILIHGFQSGIGSWVTDIRNQYLTKGEYNVIAVDWSAVSGNINYPVVVGQVPDVGHYISRLVDFLVTTGGAKISDFHIIGHSLGAHVAGFTGANVSVGTLGRITGMDPAGPLYEIDASAPARRLDPTDAAFVDVIHTCKGLLGIDYSVGHVDFYPNGGGASQPGCAASDSITGSCSHSRSHDIFAESILSDDFVAKQCSSWSDFQNNQCSTNTALMGDPVDQSVRGDYYLTTHSSSPYAVGPI